MPDNPFITSLQQRFYSITPQYLCKTKKSQKQQIATKKTDTICMPSVTVHLVKGRRADNGPLSAQVL